MAFSFARFSSHFFTLGLLVCLNLQITICSPLIKDDPKNDGNGVIFSHKIPNSMLSSKNQHQHHQQEQTNELNKHFKGKQPTNEIFNGENNTTDNFKENITENKKESVPENVLNNMNNVELKPTETTESPKMFEEGFVTESVIVTEKRQKPPVEKTQGGTTMFYPEIPPFTPEVEGYPYPDGGSLLDNLKYHWKSLTFRRPSVDFNSDSSHFGYHHRAVKVAKIDPVWARYFLLFRRIRELQNNNRGSNNIDRAGSPMDSERTSKLLKKFQTNNDGPTSYDKWIGSIESMQIPRSEVNKLVMNYLVTEGFKDAAEKFHVESGTETGIDLKTLDRRIKILEAIQEGEIQEAVHMINSYHPQLLDDNRYLFFHLQQQHLIELIRKRNVESALLFAQNHLADQGETNPDILEELERTMALLAFEEPENSPFGDLLAVSHRQKVASEFNTAFLAQQGDSRSPSISKLAYVLKFILWAQEELDKSKLKYPFMSDLTSATIEDSQK